MIKALVIRNLKCYFRDYISVFFSMLGVLIIILLYILFLGNMIQENVTEFANENARFLIDSWIMGGVIIASTVTTSLSALDIMVIDNEKKRARDFKSSPIKRSQLVLAYAISSIVIGFVMSLFTLILAEVYIRANGSFLSFTALLQTLGIMVLSVCAASSMVFFIVLFIKSSSAMGAISTVFGTMIGFLTGIYIPIGQLPQAVQTAIKLFPPSHAAALMRQVMMNEAIPISYIPEEFKLYLGMNFEFNGSLLPSYIHVLILIACTILFYGLSILVLTNKKEKE